MKIGHPTETTSISSGAGSTAKTAVREAPQPDPAKQTEVQPTGSRESVTVRLSSTARELVSGTPEFNAEKVDAVRKAIAEGRFKPNPEAIADQMIGNARELLTGPRH